MLYHGYLPSMLYHVGNCIYTTQMDESFLSFRIQEMALTLDISLAWPFSL